MEMNLNSIELYLNPIERNYGVYGLDKLNNNNNHNHHRRYYRHQHINSINHHHQYHHNRNSNNIQHYHHPWALTNYGSPTTINSSSLPRKRKMDWEDPNSPNKQMFQKTMINPWKENINISSLSSSSSLSRSSDECPRTPPNQIRSINDIKTPDTAFSLSEYLNMSPMK